jgi:uncharacterized protein YoxC
MGLIVQAVIGVAVVGSFVLAYMSHKTTRVYNIVIVNLVFIMAIPFAYLSARTLKTIGSWRVAANQMEKEVEDLDSKIQQVAEGKETSDSAAMSVRQLTHELSRFTIERGGVWRDVTPKNIKSDTGAVTITVNSPEPHGLLDKMVVFVFDSVEYQGEFVVTKGGKTKDVELAPNLPLDAIELRHLAGSRGNWTLYQVMPLDDAKLFADMTDEERGKLLPKEVAQAFTDEKRDLRNYQYIFHFNAHQRSLLSADITKVNDNLPRLATAVAKAQSEIKYRQAEKADFEADLKGFKHETQAITAYAKQLAEQVATTRAALTAVYLRVKQQAIAYVDAELKAAEKINLLTDGRQASSAP